MPEPVKPQRILITGGAGFIGVHTVNRLAAEGLELLVIDDRRHACGEPLPSSVQLETVDLNSTGAAEIVVLRLLAAKRGHDGPELYESKALLKFLLAD